MRENTTNSLIMIQPSLLSYSFQGTPSPALLDSASVSPDTILLLDTFFHVVVFHGEKIAMWRDQGYQDHEEHIHFKNLLIAPQTDAQRIMDTRFPVPRYIVCDQHKSEARYGRVCACVCVYVRVRARARVRVYVRVRDVACVYATLAHV